MNNTIELRISCADVSKLEMLVARLTLAGAEGFEEREEELLVYFSDDDDLEKDLVQYIEELGLTYDRKLIPSQNWNESWESNFQPMVIADKVGIRAGFHPGIPNVELELVITPKMSFGTGHHATTSLMIQAMLGLDLHGKNVLDFGTGTGILAILAEKKGAGSILAIDNDEWSISNAAENLDYNGCSKIQLTKADELLHLNQVFDVILANINRNVILDNLASLKRLLNRDGVLLISGLLKEDSAVISDALNGRQMNVVKDWEQGGWICLQVACKSI